MNRRHPSSASPGKKRVNSTGQLLAGGIGLLLLWLLVGCGSGDSRADLVILNGAEPESIDPAVVTGQLEGRICYAIFEGLLHFDRFGKPQPGIAERWDLSNDGKIYTFGGADPSTQAPLTTTDSYDPVTNIWSDAVGVSGLTASAALASMPVARASLAAAAGELSVCR